jgi:Hsp20/alpha crystallin family
MAGGLTRWDPLAEITHVRSRFDRLLDELGGQDHGAWMPAIDLVRHDDDLVVCVDLPGIKPEEVRIEVEDGILTVSGEHEQRRSERTTMAATCAASAASVRSHDRSRCRRCGCGSDPGGDARRRGRGDDPPAQGLRQAEDRDHAHGRVRRRMSPRPCARRPR